MFRINLKILREKAGLSQAKFAKEIGIAQSTVGGWESGAREPNFDMILKLANFFNVSTDYLIGNSDIPRQPKKGIKIPVLGDVAAGIPIEAIEDIIDYEEIDEETAKKGEFFGLRIKGDSMSPRMLEGDIVIVQKTSIVHTGDIAVVLVNGDSAMVKKYVRHNNGISLLSFNQAYAPKFYTAEEIESLPVTVIGKVVELRGKF